MTTLSVSTRKSRCIFHEIFICLTLLACIPIWAEETAPTDKEGFTNYIAVEMQKQIKDATITIKEPLSIKIGEIESNLAKVYGFCLANAEKCNAAISHYIKSYIAFTQKNNIKPTAEALRLVVRSEEYLKFSQSKLGAQGPIILSRPLAPGLVVIPMQDTPTAIFAAHDNNIKELNLSKEQTFEIAGKNTLKELKPLVPRLSPAAKGQIGTINGSLFETGRLAFLGEWELLAKTQGDLIIALPTTETILYASERTPVAVEALRTLSMEVAKKSGASPLSPTTILRWTPERWEAIP